jgi:hypothetical protein
MLALLLAAPVLAAEASPREPYSCQLQADAARQCAFGQCDDRRQQRLDRECLRDGGRPFSVPRGDRR